MKAYGMPEKRRRKVRTIDVDALTPAQLYLWLSKSFVFIRIKQK